MNESRHFVRPLMSARVRVQQARNRAALVFLTLGLVVMAASTLEAHDFWLVPDAFRLRSGDTLSVRGQTSSLFPTSLSAVSVDRIAEARIISRTSDEAVRGLSQSGNSLHLRHPVRGTGQRVLAVRLHPRSVRESAESFRRYLVLEGAPEALAKYEREGILPADSTTRRYTKYAKTIVEVGSGGPRAFSRIAGHPLEFVPVNDPRDTRVGKRFRVKLLADGIPLAGAHFHAGWVPDDIAHRSDTARARAAAKTDLKLVTNSAGEAEINISRAGLWNVRTLQIVPSKPGSGADWDVHWATLVFRPGR